MTLDVSDSSDDPEADTQRPTEELAELDSDPEVSSGCVQLSLGLPFLCGGE